MTTLGKKCILGLVLLLFSIQGTAQILKPLHESKHKLGFIYGYGTQEDLGLNAEYRYDVYYFQAQYYHSLWNWGNTGLELLMQPQYNQTKFILPDQNSDYVNGYELGLNLGLLLRKSLAQDMLSLYMLISSGPHYASVLPARQSSGFIFSDNLFVGLTIRIQENSYLDIRPGFRHLSNAGMKDPNGGVNSLIISGGLLLALN